ncbi:DUF4253 domain-containing protein [Nocardia panacis]|uniref:DUF4253 domain-containing protein n=1 Tax=Nocardia panacis TaxID=2340916 RepID=UPI00131521D6|nr:DUF4253 domain-containing protein [Nocardia panacis]
MTKSPDFPALPTDLPSGRLIRATEADSPGEGRAVLWVCDRRQLRLGELWSRLYDQRAGTGLYPLLLETPTPYDEDEQPDAQSWHNANLGYTPVEKIDALDPYEVLRELWPSESESVYAEIPSQWLHLAPEDTDVGPAARELARSLGFGTLRLIGLVPTTSGADALTLCGWHGPLNLTDSTEAISAVVRSWEQRFGAQVVMIGLDTLHLSVAAPPTSHAQALEIAAEHLAFCPDNFDFGTLDDYATKLIGQTRWNFWWD